MHFIATLLAFAKANPILASAFGLYSAGLVTFLFRHVPEALLEFIVGQLVTTVNITTDNSGFSKSNFSDFLLWWSMNPWRKYSRNYKYVSVDVDSNYSKYETGVQCDYDKNNKIVNALSAGYSRNFFVFKGVLCWFKQSKLEQKLNSGNNYSINISCLTRNTKLVQELLSSIIFDIKQDNSVLRVAAWNSGQRNYSGFLKLPKRPIDSVIMNADDKQKILDTIDDFRVSRDWYIKRGLPYKLTFVLHGLPGTGKTSIVKAIASLYDYNIYTINISTCTDIDFANAFKVEYEQSIILIEDIDACKSTMSRFDDGKDSDDDSDGAVGAMRTFTTVSLTTILNTLDGVMQLNNCIVFITTNQIDKLDDAMIRKGRVDYIIELGKLTDTEVRDYIKVMYDNVVIPDGIKFKEVEGCILHGLFIENKYNPDNFIRVLSDSIESVK